MRLLFNLFTIGLLVAGTPPVAAETGRPGGLPANLNPGELTVLEIDGKKPEKPLQLPLQHTDVRLTVSGFVARATVTQHYANPFESPIEAVYTFPLPNQAAVDGMTMYVGDRVVRADIKRREEARKIYQQAKASGQRTGLLEQERPNIFTQSVGNIMPGDKIKIEVTYVDILQFRDEGNYELIFPMVVGPRYIPGNATGQSGTGWAPDTDQVPDASRITPPVLKPGQRSGHDINLAVDLDAAVKIRGVHSVSHAVDIEEISANKRKINLHRSDTLPNKDFVLRYQVAGKVPEMALITHHTEKQGGFFTFIVLPQQEVTDTETVARDLIFILDTSGSMRGFPLEKSKEAMKKLINGMRSSDRFNIVRFAGDTGTLWSSPQPKTPQNVRIAEQFVDNLRGAGGTEMRKGIVEALAQPSDPERMRIAFLLTDGYVGNETGILQSIEQERRGARIFTLGVGSSTNRYLLDRAATLGRGEAFYVRQDETATSVIDSFFKRVDRPALADIEIDWNGLAVKELIPRRIPDLWQGQPLLIHGRYSEGGQRTITIRGLLGGEKYERHIKLYLPENQPENQVMSTVWARAKVKHLMLDMARSQQGKEIIEQITELGLQHRIMTQWTSFVAVEEKVVNIDGELKTIVQPVELPEGVDYEGIFAAEQDDAALGGSRSMAPTAMKRYAAPQMLQYQAVPETAAGARQEYRKSRADRLVDAKEEMLDPRCKWDALSVSGGLKYPAVQAVLQAGWNSLCRTLHGKYHSKTSVVVELAVSLDGKVQGVMLRPDSKIAAPLNDALVDWFKGLRFGPVPGRGLARISLEVKLQL